MAAAAVALAAATGGWLAVGADDRLVRWTNVLAAALAAVLLAAGLALRRPTVVLLAVLVLGAGYATALAIDGGPLDGRAPVVAAALFAVAELGHWSLELRDTVADEAGAHLRRIGLLSALALGSLAVGSGLLAVVDAGGGVRFEALGAVAAVAALAIVVVATRRRPR
ncbi:MAG: hypothetical protein H0T13_06880 [Actinobacteria bacterium]|nr:hypothetical protein [Actinomycetota bacterium]